MIALFFFFSRVFCEQAMFTKTGLRPRETRSRSDTISGNATNGGGRFTNLKPRSGVGEKPRPITDIRRRQVPTTRLGAAATAGMTSSEPSRAMSAVSTRGGAERVIIPWEKSQSSIRRKSFGDRGTNSRGRREMQMHGGGGGGRSRSAGRKREVSTTPRARHPIRKRPEWDDSLRDTSQYRLTPEEAMRRKISLVSKHNTLVFGLGSGSTPTAACSSSAAGEVARRRSAKRVEHRQQRSRKTSTSVAAPANSKKSVSAIYGGGGGGLGRTESDVVLEPASATEDDAAVSRLGIDPTDPCDINDATITLYAKCGGGDNLNTCERSDGDGSGGGSSSDCEDGDKDELELSLPDGKGGSGDGCKVSGSSGLAGIEVGIEAFGKRVGRLEAYRKVGLGEERTPGERGGRASEIEGRGRDQVDYCGGEPDDVSLCPAEFHEGVALGGLLCKRRQCHATADDGDSSNHLPADAGHDATEGNRQEQDQRHSYHSCANPWRYSTPSAASSGRDQRVLQKVLASRSPSTSDDGGRDEGDLAKRIQLLEAQVLQLGSARTPATTAAAKPDIAGGNQKAASHQTGVGAAVEPGQKEPAARGRVDAARHPGSAAREKQMRAVIADLLSLSAVLLERATDAERRLRDTADCDLDCQHVVGGDIGGDTNDIDERARLVRASAEAVVALTGDDDSTVVPPTATNQMVTTAASTAATTTTATASASALLEEVTALRPGGGLVERSPPPPRRNTTPRSTTNDCWGEALDAVGDLVGRQTAAFGRDEAEGVAVASTGTETPTKSSPPLSPRFSSPLGVVPLLPVAVAAATPGSTSYHANTAKQKSSVAGQLSLQPPLPPPQNTATGAAHVRLWRPATQHDDDNALAAPVPVDTAGNTLFADDGCVTADPVHVSRLPDAAAPREVEGLDEEEKEEDARASPASSAPVPSNMPQHPFGGNRTGSRMRSPRWLRQPVGLAGGGGAMSGSAPWSGFSAAVIEADEGRDDASMHGGSAREQGRGFCGGDEISKALRPPIGQWYTPAAYPGGKE